VDVLSSHGARLGNEAPEATGSAAGDAMRADAVAFVPSTGRVVGAVPAGVAAAVDAACETAASGAGVQAAGHVKPQAPSGLAAAVLAASSCGHASGAAYDCATTWSAPAVGLAAAEDGFVHVRGGRGSGADGAGSAAAFLASGPSVAVHCGLRAAGGHPTRATARAVRGAV
jgi:hypothetical protein